MLLPSPTGRAGSAAAFSEEAFDVSLKDASAGGGGGGGGGRSLGFERRDICLIITLRRRQEKKKSQRAMTDFTPSGEVPGCEKSYFICRLDSDCWKTKGRLGTPG